MERLERVRKAMQAKELTGLIITNPFNLAYLSGFDGLDGDGVMVITPSEATLITDQRYQLVMQDQLVGTPIDLQMANDYYQTAVQALKTVDGPVGIEGTTSASTYQGLKTALGTRLVITNDLVEIIRRVKQPTEIETLRASCQLASEAYAALLQFVHAGLTERSVALFLYQYMVEHGAQKPSFDTIVASGVRSAFPHGSATDKYIEPGDMVTVDFGFYFDGYTSDMTRTFAVGNPGPELKAAYQVVQVAQEKMIAGMLDGADSQQVDSLARDYIAEQGYGEYFNHGSGHGIGLDIHEGPIINARQQHQLQAGYVMTAEPGIYLPDQGGIRIEDDVLITDHGPELLTHGTRDLVIVEP